MIVQRKLWVLVTCLGLLSTILAAVIFPLFPDGGHAISDGYGGTVYAFEMARTSADLTAVFGPETDLLRASRIAAMNKGNLWDYAFMPAYAGFMGTFLWGAYRETDQKAWLIFGIIGLLSGVFDAIENAILLGITADLKAAPLLTLLAFPVWAKFFSIAIAVASAGLFIAQQNGLFRIAGLLTTFAMLAVLAAFYDASKFGSVSAQAIAFGWAVMLIYALNRSFSKTN